MFGIKDGFDIVIGNPPYVPMESLDSKLRDEYKKKCDLFTRKFETSVLFIFQGLHLLKKTGVVTFIAPMTWQTGENYTRFRKYILSQRGILKIINLPFDVFEAAYIDTCIYLLSSKSAKYYDYFSFDKKAKELDLSGIKFDKVDITQISSPDYKLILDNDIGKIIARFSSANYTILGDITKSTQGLSGSNLKKQTEVGKVMTRFLF